VSSHLTPTLWAFLERWLPTPPARLIDVGCGDGEFTLKSRAAGFECLGVDPLAPNGPGFIRSTLEDFLPDSRFDAAVAIRSLHHLHDLDAAVDRLAQALEPGGRLVMSEFSIEAVDEAARSWLAERALPAPFRRGAEKELIPLSRLRAALSTRFTLLAQEPTPYLTREAGRVELEPEEVRAIEAGELEPAGVRLAYEMSRR
jgi:ubiquinone/menaquinone biosynthesis C-methylase UbiE